MNYRFMQLSDREPSQSTSVACHASAISTVYPVDPPSLLIHHNKIFENKLWQIRMYWYIMQQVLVL